jgi:hypothetical protein
MMDPNNAECGMLNAEMNAEVNAELNNSEFHFFICCYSQFTSAFSIQHSALP